MKLFYNLFLGTIFGGELIYRKQRAIDHPCPSFTCWDWNEATGECDLKEDDNCLKLECLYGSMNITFSTELFGVDDPNFFDPILSTELQV